LVAGTSHDGGEHGTRSIISSESGLAHSGSIVDNEGLNVGLLVRHLEVLCLIEKSKQIKKRDG
jgi:hypothetical protein